MRLVAGLSAALTCGILGCAAPGSDIHLAPFWTRLNTADTGVEVEAAGGLWRQRRAAEDEFLEELTVGPLYGISNERSGDYTSQFLVPLGFVRARGEEARSLLFPLWVWHRRIEADGSVTRQVFCMPLVLVRSNSVRGTEWGWFPIYGNFDEKLLTWDKITWVLWPLYTRTEQDGVMGTNVGYSLLWPFFAWSTGGGRMSWRVWPLYGVAKKEGRYERHFWLWPFLHYQKNFLGGGTEEPEKIQMAWPFMGKTARGTYRAYAWLWPFFGYSHDSRHEPGGEPFWALDAPWPLVRFQRGPGVTRRSRVWPFYGYLRTETLEQTSYLWPFITFRKEDTRVGMRKSTYVIPFWISSSRREKELGTTSSFRKLFPLFKHRREDQWRRTSFPTLDPLWRNSFIDRYYAWIWKLYEWETKGDMYRSRSWLAIYRRERGLGEDRKSLTGLWSSRKYQDGERKVKETSLLFGLLRWRVTEGKGLSMLRPAFPGPGWPAHPGAPADG